MATSIEDGQSHRAYGDRRVKGDGHIHNIGPTGDRRRRWPESQGPTCDRRVKGDGHKYSKMNHSIGPTGDRRVKGDGHKDRR